MSCACRPEGGGARAGGESETLTARRQTLELAHWTSSYSGCKRPASCWLLLWQDCPGTFVRTGPQSPFRGQLPVPAASLKRGAAHRGALKGAARRGRLHSLKRSGPYLGRGMLRLPTRGWRAGDDLPGPNRSSTRTLIAFEKAVPSLSRESRCRATSGEGKR